MQAKMYNLNNKKSACKTRRNVNFDFQAGAEDFIMKSIIIYDAIDNVIYGKMTEKELADSLDERFKALNYHSEKQRKIHAADAFKQIVRYTDSEKKVHPVSQHRKCFVMDVPLNEELTINGVKPHRVFEYYDVDGGRVLEFVRFKCKKPSMTEDKQRYADRHKNLELYTLLKYGRMYLGEGEKAKIKASVFYLRKSNDSDDEKKACFDRDFFNLKGGLNIVSDYEYFVKKLGEGHGEDSSHTDKDKAYKQAVLEYINGIPEEACTESDCKNCEFKPICKFSDPPMKLEEKKETRAASTVKLTKKQRQAKEYEKGIARINAGAGAGKTLTVSLRVISLLNKGVKPEEIFMTTFTKAGAQEMYDRIVMLAEDDGIAEEVDMRKLRIMTFNAFGDEILKKEYERFGFPEVPRLIDDVERYRIVADMLEEYDIPRLNYRDFSQINRRGYGKRGALVVASRVFQLFKLRPQISYSEIDDYYEELVIKEEWATKECSKDTFQELYELYRIYDERLRENCLIEYSDQENMIFELLEMEPHYFERFGFKHLIVDEFQDSSQKQIDIIKTFVNCRTFESLMVVGDDSQSIYSFRDTSPDFLIDFGKYMGTKNIDDIMLIENHRSTPEIIDFANKINAMNKEKVAKDLIATRPHGEPVTVKGFLKSQEERDYIVAKVAEYIKNGTKPEDIAILARNKAELNKMADLLAKEDIPSFIQFPTKLVDNSRVQALLSMMRAIEDSGATTDLLIYANAVWHVETGRNLKDEEDEKYDEACSNARTRIEAYKELEEEEEKIEKLKEMFEELDPDKKDDIYQSFAESLLARSSEKMFEYVRDFRIYGEEETARMFGNYPGVILSTAHSSKGLEWPIVFNMIGGYDAPEFHKGRLSSATAKRLEEERRLLFVSSTRARDILYVTAQYTSGGKMGEYQYNTFLQNSYEANGQEFNITYIEQERTNRKLQDEAKKREEKEKKKAEAKAAKEAEKAEKAKMAEAKM